MRERGRPQTGTPAPKSPCPGPTAPRTAIAPTRCRNTAASRWCSGLTRADDTPICTRQLIAYTKDFGAFEALRTTMLAINPQDLASHDRFAAGHGGFAFPLLTDEDKSVGQAYGVLGPLGFYRRSVFAVDGEGVIRYAHRSLTGLGFQASDTLLEAVRAARN